MSAADLDRLRERFAKIRDVDGDGARCPGDERIRESAAGRLSPPEEESILLHISGCGVCAASWRLARDLLSESGLEREPGGAATRRSQRTVTGWIGLAAAAVLAVGLGGLLTQRVDSPAFTTPAFRDEVGIRIESVLDAAVQLPREDFVVRWAGAPAGTTYDLRVTSERLVPLYRVFGLDTAEHRIPPESLADVPAGSSVLWSVSARLPDGRRLPAVTFRTTVE